jgi:hypothetical protein
MEQILPGNDRRVVKATQASLEEMGVRFFLGDAVESVEQHGDRVRATLRSGEVLEADVVMSAPGRIPNSAGFGYPEAGIEMDRAAVKVDEHFRTNVSGVYAIGDLIGGMMLAHVAEEEGTVAARNAVAELKTVGAAPQLESVRYDCIPACVYTFPEVAVVGSTRDSAKERGIDAVQAVAKFAANGKALGEGEAEGFVQLAAEKGTGRIVGARSSARTLSRSSTRSRSRCATASRAPPRRDGARAPHRERGREVRRARRRRQVRLLRAGTDEPRDLRTRSEAGAAARVAATPDRHARPGRRGRGAPRRAATQHRLPERQVPEQGRVLLERHRDVPDHGRRVHARLPLLRGRDPRTRAARRRRAGAGRRGGAAHGARARRRDDRDP